MAENGFPKTVEDVVATLVKIYHLQGNSGIVELLESGSARIEELDYDNLNSGIYTYQLMLDVPVPVFLSANIRLQAIEDDISDKLVLDQPHFGKPSA